MASGLIRFEDLREERDLVVARELIEAYPADGGGLPEHGASSSPPLPASSSAIPSDAARQREFRARLLAWIDRYPLDAHLRTRLEGHLTASALVVNHERTHALLTHHKKLDRWLQLGGHCDGDANLARVALREAIEESGIEDLTIDPRVLDLDIHSIPARGNEPLHLHLDVRFCVTAPRGARAEASDESHALAWVSVADLASLTTDESVKRLFVRAFGAPLSPH